MKEAGNDIQQTPRNGKKFIKQYLAERQFKLSGHRD